MRVKNWTLPYIVCYILVWFTKQGFFRRVTRQGLSNIPKNKPVIFAANHQNSLIDPIVIATTNRYPVFFLTKSDVFKNPIIAKILYSFNMLPIYRERDGADFMEKNKAIFDRCSDILEGNGRIIIFPEGSHNNKNRLRRLKKGIARIALQAHENSEEDIWIVPVGLNYTNTRNKCADLFLSYGKAINASEKFSKNTNSENEELNQLMEEVSEGLGNEMLDYRNEQFYDLYDFFVAKIKRPKNSVKANFIWAKDKSEKLNSFVKNNETKANEMLGHVNEINKICKEKGLRPYLFDKKHHSLLLPVLVLILGFPIFVYGAVNSYIPSVIPQKTVLKNIKDRQYDTSINMVLGGFLMFFFWCIQSFVVSLFTNDYIWSWYFISCVVFRWFSYEYHIFYLRFIGKKNYNKLRKNSKQLSDSLIEKYASLKHFILNL